MLRTLVTCISALQEPIDVFLFGINTNPHTSSTPAILLALAHLYMKISIPMVKRKDKLRLQHRCRNLPTFRNNHCAETNYPLHEF